MTPQARPRCLITSDSQPAETGISLLRKVNLSFSSTSSPQTGTDKIAASKMPLKVWILVLTQETRNPSSYDSSFSTSRVPKGISRVSAKMTASSAKYRSEILTFPKDAPQLDLSDILPRIQSIQVLKSVGASTHF